MAACDHFLGLAGQLHACTTLRAALDDENDALLSGAQRLAERSLSCIR